MHLVPQRRSQLTRSHLGTSTVARLQRVDAVVPHLRLRRMATVANGPAAVSQGLVLVVLFVVLPFVVAGGVIAFVSWRSVQQPAPLRTSEILRTGEPGRGEVLAVRNLGTILEVRPMVRIDLRVTPVHRPTHATSPDASSPDAGSPDAGPTDGGSSPAMSHPAAPSTPYDGRSFEISVTQALPRAVVRGIAPGDVVEVRITADRSAAAVVLS